MAFLDDNILNDWDEKISFALGAESPTAVEVIEIAVCSNEPPSISRKALEPNQIREWAAETESSVESTSQSTSGPPCYRLRLLLAGCNYQRQAARAHMSEFPLPQRLQPWYFPFSREDYDLVRLKLNLPRSTSVIFSKNAWYHFTSSHFGAYSNASGLAHHDDHKGNMSDSMGITMKFPGSDLVSMDASMSMSHSITNRSTNALLLCRYSCQASYISDMVVHLAGLATHPAAIPTMLCSLYQATLRRQVSSTWETLLGVEHASGQTGIQLVDPSGEILPTGSCDDPGLSTRAIRAVQLATAWETYVPRGNKLLTAVESFLESYVKEHVQKEDEILVKQSRMLQEYLILELQRADHLNYSVNHLLQRSKIQVETINNYLAHTSNQINQKIALNTQMDSSSMKSVAILTMSFLPATFLAALFATPGVSSTQPSQGLYWAITIPITAVVFGIWATWAYTSTRKMKVISKGKFVNVPSHSKDQVVNFPLVPGEIFRNPNLQAIRVEQYLPQRSVPAL